MAHVPGSSERTRRRTADRAFDLASLTLSSAPIALNTVLQELALVTSSALRLGRALPATLIDALSRIVESLAVTFSDVDLERLHPNVRRQVRGLRDRGRAKEIASAPGAEASRHTGPPGLSEASGRRIPLVIEMASDPEWDR